MVNYTEAPMLFLNAFIRFSCRISAQNENEIHRCLVCLSQVYEVSVSVRMRAEGVEFSQRAAGRHRQQPARRPSTQLQHSLFRFSPSPGSAPHLLNHAKMHLSALGAIGALNGLQVSPGPSLKKGTGWVMQK